MRWPATLLALLAVPCGSAGAATLEPIGSFEEPIFVTSDPRDPERILIVEREGRVVEVAPGGTRVFADISALVSCCESERGMLSIVPAPDFNASGRFYAAYTGTEADGQEGDVHVDSFRPDPGDASQVIREPIVSIGHSQEANHNGGQLQFGPDGYLYVSLGDGGGGGDPFENGQDTEELLGKILRIVPRPGQTPSYEVPAGNPFLAGPGRDEIWASGLRNPWRFSFDRASGGMVVADVGQDAREEVDYAPSPGGGVVSGAGANYGWNCREGFLEYEFPPAGCGSAAGFTEPVFDYPHEDPGDGSAHGCSIIGGYVVRDASVGDLYGRYVYTDFCSEEIRSLLLPGSGGVASDDRSEGLTVDRPTSFGEDSCGRVYVTSREGAVFRLQGDSPAVCPSLATATPISRMQRRARLRISARSLGASGHRFKVRVRLLPCTGAAGRRVALRRDGRRIAAKRLDRRCTAHFRLRIARRASLRAVAPASGNQSRVRSRRLVLRPRR